MNLLYPPNIALPYVIYVTYREDELIYIGSGKRGRENHTISGTSNNKQLNKSFFDNDRLETFVVCELSCHSSTILLEKLLINHHQPTFNIVHKQLSKTDIEEAWFSLESNISKYRETYIKNYQEWVRQTINLFIEDDFFKNAAKVYKAIFIAEYANGKETTRGLYLPKELILKDVYTLPDVASFIRHKHISLVDLKEDKNKALVYIYLMFCLKEVCSKNFSRVERGCILNEFISDSTSLVFKYRFPFARFIENSKTGPSYYEWIYNDAILAIQSKDKVTNEND